MIPYQMITDFDSLKIEPKEDFFKKEDFYSELKEKNISDEEYQNVKKFFMLLRLKTLGDMKRIYNFQDTLILCEIFEQRASFLEKLFNFNPRKSNSASSFSGTVHRNSLVLFLLFSYASIASRSSPLFLSKFSFNS